MKNKIRDFLFSSFLQEFLQDENITDVSYNGSDVYYYHLGEGRMKSSLKISKEEVSEFLRQIANLGEKMFSIACPYMDLSIEHYRLSAVHKSISRKHYEKSPVFSLRIGRKNSLDLIKLGFMPEYIANLLKALVTSGQSILISGQSGAGKTELQRYLLDLLPISSKVIIIDNSDELDSFETKLYDCITFSVKEAEYAQFANLLKISLSHNPDWIVIAESRGTESKEVLSSALSGHPIITTMHSNSSLTTPMRFLKMMGSLETNELSMLENFALAFPYIVHVARSDTSKGVKRYLSEIVEVTYDNGIKLNYIYRNSDNFCGELSKKALDILNTRLSDTKSIKRFVGAKK